MSQTHHPGGPARQYRLNWRWTTSPDAFFSVVFCGLMADMGHLGLVLRNTHRACRLPGDLFHGRNGFGDGLATIFGIDYDLDGDFLCLAGVVGIMLDAGGHPFHGGRYHFDAGGRSLRHLFGRCREFLAMLSSKPVASYALEQKKSYR